MHIVYLIATFVTLILLPFESGAELSTTKPNIVFIMADDLGYGDLGCYGQRKIMTPHLDRLAATGALFTNAYAGSSVCAPSRCSLLTGKHNGHNRIRDNVPHGIYLQPDDFTIAELLKQAGYKTGGIGKWGLGNPGSWGVPNQQGFDYFYGHYDQDQAHYYYPDHLWENDKLVLLKQNKADKKGAYTHDLFTQKAMDFIKLNAQNPFFLYLSYTVPHFSDYSRKSPDVYIVPSDEPYANQPWTQTAKNYAAMISRMDTDVGKLQSLIEELGLSENTIIVFTSDNGPYTDVAEPMQFFNSNGPWKGGKRSFYEGGIRVPFIVNWKNVIKPHTQVHTPIAFWDILPTLAELIHYPSLIETDGHSIVPLFTESNAQTTKERAFYWDYGHTRDEYQQAVRKGKFKGIQTFTKSSAPTFELYDLLEDPKEEKNIATRYPTVVNELKKIMQESFQYSAAYDPKVNKEQQSLE